MNNDEQQLNTLLKHIRGHVRLSQNERMTMESTLREYMSIRPLRNRGGRISSPASRNWTPLRMHSLRLVTLSLLLIVLGSGVSYAAEEALPGDALYGVKVNVNEEVRALLAVTHAQESEWAAERIARRLEETEKLALDGRLDAGHREEIASQIDVHADTLEKSVDTLKKSNDIEVLAATQARVEASLNAHERILSRLEQDDEMRDEVRTLITDLTESVRSQREHAGVSRTEAETRALETKTDASEKLVAHKLKAVIRVHEKNQRNFERRGKGFSEDAQNEIARVMDEAGDHIASAEKALEDNSYAEALTDLQDAFRYSYEGALLIEIAHHTKEHDSEDRDVPNDDFERESSQSTKDGDKKTDTVNDEPRDESATSTATSSESYASSTESSDVYDSEHGTSTIELDLETDADEKLHLEAGKTYQIQFDFSL